MDPGDTPELALQQSSERQIKKKMLIPFGVSEHYFTNVNLCKTIAILPAHYNFEIQKTLHRIDTLAKELGHDELTVSLQFPEGLMLFACIISDILTAFAKPKLQTVILGDVTYGACCIDDIASQHMGCDLLVHYGHSCLVPITETRGKVLYVFVEIQIDIKHFVDTIHYNFQSEKSQVIHLMGTIQFNNSLFLAKQMLAEIGFSQVVIPQEKPRSAGEVLGCTSPRLLVRERNIVIFLCDGRFHMEAAMIANPEYEFYQYDPYSRAMTEEKYATNLMITRRQEEISRAKQGKRNRVCLIFGALGRQGNLGLLDRLIAKVQERYTYMVLIASEITIELLESVDVDFFVQIACPRLSIDWSYGTRKPLLTPYELYALMDSIDLSGKYRMDYYSFEGGPWSNFYGRSQTKKSKKDQLSHEKETPKVKLQMQLNGCNSQCKGQCQTSKEARP